MSPPSFPPLTFLFLPSFSLLPPYRTVSDDLAQDTLPQDDSKQRLNGCKTSMASRTSFKYLSSPNVKLPATNDKLSSRQSFASCAALFSASSISVFAHSFGLSALISYLSLQTSRCNGVYLDNVKWPIFDDAARGYSSLHASTLDSDTEVLVEWSQDLLFTLLYQLQGIHGCSGILGALPGRYFPNAERLRNRRSQPPARPPSKGSSPPFVSSQHLRHLVRRAALSRPIRNACDDAAESTPSFPTPEDERARAG
ncbi:hypothetical protein C8J57DRAFT_1534215 [Mycena rebaudengoi]|nr:hypothetical protein C8J57DRAFT_1534215 [Mycena rebaudengoi]